MKTFVYIGIIGASALLLASCKGKSKPMETPVPSISVSTPIVRDITLTKEYPGYLSSQLKVDLPVSTDTCVPLTSRPEAG